eukprot:4852216-Prorocentrum_lima.AAC.1
MASWTCLPPLCCSQAVGSCVPTLTSGQFMKSTDVRLGRKISSAAISEDILLARTRQEQHGRAAPS